MDWLTQLARNTMSYEEGRSLRQVISSTVTLCQRTLIELNFIFYNNLFYEKSDVAVLEEELEDKSGRIFNFELLSENAKQ